MLISFPENRKWLKVLALYEWVMSDIGFQGQDKETYRWLMPFPNSQTLEKKEYNAFFSSLRAKVENVIGEVKQWKVCAERFRNDRKTPPMYWRVCAALTNFERLRWQTPK
jgi:hypothetical protein